MYRNGNVVPIWADQDTGFSFCSVQSKEGAQDMKETRPLLEATDPQNTEQPQQEYE